MGEHSKISWTDHTFNPWIGCQEVSSACDFCYARIQNEHRHWVDGWGPHGQRRRTSKATWVKVYSYQRNAAAFYKKHGRRQRIFCASLADWLDNKADPQWRSDLITMIENTPDLDWLLLSKRPENYEKLVPSPLPKNVWFGITAEDQDNFARRWAIAREIPATIHFVSYEPALGPLVLPEGKKPDWLIGGGESGPKRREMSIPAMEAVAEQCANENVAFFFKQDSHLRSGQRGRASDALWGCKQFPKVAA